MEHLIEIQNVTKTYGNYIALNNININIPKGRIFGLLGPNGAGKTSLIRILNQITMPDSGQIRFNGQPLKSYHEQHIGYLPEERGLYKKMKVGEQALYLAQLKGKSRSDALRSLRWWFDRFAINEWWDKKVEELSKGMAQKVQFIVTVLHEPELLILDEPFSGFDPVNANLIKAEIKRLNQAGTTIIFSTHNMGSVEEICDDIALIHQAECILQGSVPQIRNQFKEGVFEVVFSGNKMAFTNALWTQFELLDIIGDEQQHVAKIKLLNQNTTNNLLQAILPVCNVTGLQEVVPSLNEVFIKQVSPAPETTTQSDA